MGRPRSIRRVNWKALIGTALVSLVLVGGGLLAAGVFRDRVRSQVLEQAEALVEQGNAALAMRHLERFLARKPDDVEILDRYTELLSEAVLTSGDGSRLDPALANNERLLRLDPEGRVAEDPQRNRRWFVELSILKSERTRADYGGLNFQEAFQDQAMLSRYRAAEVVARELIDRLEEDGEDDAEAHRLLALAREGLAEADRPGYLTDHVIPEYQKALELDPTDALSAARLAWLYRDRLAPPRPDDAERVLEDLIKAAPGTHDAWLAVYRHYAGHDPERAAEALAKAIAIAPDEIEVILTAASDAVDRGERDHARELLGRLPESVRNGPRVELLLATLDYQERQTDEAIGRLREALATAGGADAQLVWTLANALIESGNLAEAWPLVRSFARLDESGGQANARYLEGLYYRKAGEPLKAISLFDAAERGLNDELRAQMLVSRGQSKIAVDKRVEGVRDLRAAVGLAPGLALARLALAEALLPVEGVDRTLEQIRQGIAVAPESLELRQALLQMLLAVQAGQAGQRSWSAFDLAMEDARAALGDEPTLVALDAQRKLIDGRYDEAIADLEEAAGDHLRAAVLWANWIDALNRAGRREEALEVLGRASAPEAVGDNAGFRVARAKLLAQLGRGREAIEVLAEGATSLPSDQRGQVLEALGQMQAARGQFADARATYLAWKRLQPGLPGPLLAQLGLAIDTGDRAGAEEALRELRGGQGREEAPLPYLLGMAEYLIRGPGDDPAARAQQAIDLLVPILGEPLPNLNEDPPEGWNLGALPDLSAALMLRGLAYRQLGEQKEGAESVDRLNRAVADLKRAWEQGEQKALEPMIDLMARLDRFGEIDGLPRIGPGGLNAEIDRLAAEASVRYGRNDNAAKYLGQTTDAAAPTPQFAAWRMTMLDRLGETPQVEQSLRSQAEKLNDAASWVTLVRYQAARGQRDRALQSIAEMKRVVEVDPPELLEAQALEAIGDAEAAGDAYEAALARRPDDPQVLLTVARFDHLNGRPDRALERADRVLAADPSSRPASRFKALVLSDRITDVASWQRAWDALGPEPGAGDSQEPEERLARAILLARHPEPSRREEGVGRLEALIEDQPSGELAVAARETLARLLLEEGRPDRAAEVAAVGAVGGTNPNAITLYAQALIASDQLDEAARQLEHLANLAPDSAARAELDLMLVEARAEAGSEAEELEAVYRQAVDATGDEGRPAASAVTTAAAIFRRLVAIGESAEEVADRVGRDLAGRFPVLAWMPAQWLASRDAFPGALDLAEQAIGSDDPAAAFQAARAVLTVVERSNADPAHMDRAAALIERAAGLGGLAATRATLAMFRHFQGRTDPARYDDEIRIYNELLESDEGNIIYLNNLAWALSECANQPEEALGRIDFALKDMEPRVPELVDTRAVILDRLGRHEEAIAELQEVIRQRPNKGHYYFHLARAQAAAGLTDDARSSMARASELGLTPEDVEPVEREDLERLKAL